ncbi:unnamed protein product, partial [Prorocentrum cordatum]
VDWVVRCYTDPVVVPDDAATVSMDSLPLRLLHSGLKHIKYMVDIIENWIMPDGVSLDTIAEAHKNGVTDDSSTTLPAGIAPAQPLPKGAIMQIIVHKETVLKHFIFPTLVSAKVAASIAVGRAHTIAHRPNTCGAREAFQQLLERTGGWKLLLVGGMQQWNPTPEQLQAGVDWVNRWALAGVSMNQQLAWIRVQTRDADSPTYKWPKSEVKELVSKEGEGHHQADPEMFFPLTVYDLKPALVDKILPLILTPLATSGCMVTGKAGDGKTQFAKIVGMTTGRRRSMSDGGDGATAGWRRGTLMDVFRDTPGSIEVGCLLDDPTPSITDIDPETLKSFLGVGEDCLRNARYNPAKFCIDQFRCAMRNDWDEASEPAKGFGPTSEETFLAALKRALADVPDKHLWAIMKRGVAIIAGHNGARVRMPSERKGQFIYTFDADDVGDDWLQKTNKPWLNEHRKGKKVAPEGHAEAAREEHDYIVSLVDTTPTQGTRRRWAVDWGSTQPPRRRRWIRSTDGVAPQGGATPNDAPAALIGEPASAHVDPITGAGPSRSPASPCADDCDADAMPPVGA